MPAQIFRAIRVTEPKKLGRYGHADEVAALISFVAGPESSYINGAN